MFQTIYTPTVSKVEEHDADKKASFIIEPLLPGYGMTLGNSLRRVLLSSISGAAVVSFRVDGATHEFTTIPGVKEDLVQIMLNLKGLRFRVVQPIEDTETEASVLPTIQLNVQRQGTGPVTGADIQLDARLELVNPEHLIATLDGANDKINMDLTIGFGLGYLPIEDSEANYAKNDAISLDALFSPVLRVRFKLENTRIGRVTNLDKLILTVETDGSMTPREAFEEASAILKEHYSTLSGTKDVKTQTFHPASEAEAAGTDVMPTDDRLSLQLENLQLSARTTNALVNNDCYTVQDILNLSERELKELKGFGKVGLIEIKEKMKELGF